MSNSGSERWRRLTVKEGWRRFVGDEPTQRPERLRVADYRRLDKRSRSAYDLERLRHAHGFGPIRSLYADVHRSLERLVVSNELRGPGARHGAALDGNPGNGKTFYGMGLPRRASARELTQLVLECARCCQTSLIVIDNIHLLELRREADRDANNHLKRLANDLQATFVYAGVGLSHGGFMHEGRLGPDAALAQISQRFTLRAERSPVARW